MMIIPLYKLSSTTPSATQPVKVVNYKLQALVTFDKECGNTEYACYQYVREWLFNAG